MAIRILFTVPATGSFATFPKQSVYQYLVADAIRMDPQPVGIPSTAKRKEDDERSRAAAGIEQVDQVGIDDVLGITADRLERVRRELGLVRLSWQGRVNLEDIEKENSELQWPDSYRTVSDIEKTLLWYAENFRRQCRAVYPHRKPLLLTCANECGVQKFVSTSIRRTLLPYAELSTWQDCASFVSDHFAYEPLVEPLLMVSRAPVSLQLSLLREAAQD
ncbi:hypothetical protein TSAR_013989 [Trichomalopsis sarcophagae]|uniref:Uncharacterized protein n=1 Tax=Trichomalopsis sarcophagae TaxID=543379 RepID=A0A232EP69_9HYME|nr:hypothetical protein TSAR_013989 [Trichomalopsis sarcophagae]